MHLSRHGLTAVSQRGAFLLSFANVLQHALVLNVIHLSMLIEQHQNVRNENNNSNQLNAQKPAGPARGSWLGRPC